MATTARGAVIAVTRLDGQKLFVNADVIETIEQTPDTIVSFTSGHKMLVRDHPEVLIRRAMEYRRATLRPVDEAGESPARVDSDTTAERS
jgi:flagellar protein FlbD